MIELAALVLIGAAVAGVFVVRGRRRAAGARPRRGARPDAARLADPDAPPDVQLAQFRRSGAVWGVMLRVPPGQGCAAVQGLRDTRYPLERAPSLPVRGCDSPRCRCGYTALKERRRKDVLPPDGNDRRTGSDVKWDIYKS